VRKLRIALSDRGNRGGARLIYFFREAKGRVYMILVFAKGRKENLTAAGRSAMKKLTAAIEGER